MASDEVVALREQIDILEVRIPELSFTRRAALNVIRKNSLTDAYQEEIEILASLGDPEAIRYLEGSMRQERQIVYSQARPIIGGRFVEDCSSYTLGETTWNDPLTGTHTGLRCLERHPEHPSMQCMKLRDHKNVIRTTEPTIHYFCFGSQLTIHWKEQNAEDN